MSASEQCCSSDASFTDSSPMLNGDHHQVSRPMRQRSASRDSEQGKRKRDHSPSCSEDPDQDQEPVVVLAPSHSLEAGPLAKRRKSATKSGENGQNNDIYCWVCHKEVPVATSSFACRTCPRAFHTRCMVANADQQQEADQQSSQGACAECTAIERAENVMHRSSAMQLLSLDQFCTLLKFSVARMKIVIGAEPFLKAVDLSEFPRYGEYVVHPMDLSQLERNIRRKQYGSTEAFLADAKWILHNSIIFNTCQTKLTGAARLIVKACRQEMAEIETCPDCYLNAHTRKESWFTDVCRTPHLLVWAKLKGYPYWPAKAMKVNKESAVDVRFFGAHDKAWVPVKDCFLYSKEIPAGTKKKNKMENCLEEAEQHTVKLKERFGAFSHAPPRTPFDPEQHDKQLNMLLPNYRPGVDGKRARTILHPEISSPSASNRSSLIGKTISSPALLAKQITTTRSGRTIKAVKKEIKTEEYTNGSQQTDSLEIDDKEENSCDREPERQPEIEKESSICEENSLDREIESSGEIDGEEPDSDREVENSSDKETENTPEIENLSEKEPATSSDREIEDSGEEENSPEFENLSEKEIDENSSDREIEDSGEKETENSPEKEPAADTEIEDSGEKENSSDGEIESEGEPETEKEVDENSSDTVKDKEIDKEIEKEKEINTSEEEHSKSKMDYMKQLTLRAKTHEDKIKEKELADAAKICFKSTMNKLTEIEFSSSKVRLSTVQITPVPKRKSPPPPQEDAPKKPKKSEEEVEESDGEEAIFPSLFLDPSVTITVVENNDKKSSDPVQLSSDVSLTVVDKQPPPPPQNTTTPKSSSKARKSMQPQAKPGVIAVKKPSTMMPNGTQQKAAAESRVFAPRPPQLQPRPLSGHTATGPPPEAGPATSELHKHAGKLSEYVRQSLESLMRDLSNLGSPQASLGAMQLEMERMQWRHQQELAELKHNADLVMLEMRASLESERARALSEVRRQADADKQRAVEETKKKQWCAYCNKEALFYCCWNTSYCDYPCQQAHWPRHMSSCAQKYSKDGGPQPPKNYPSNTKGLPPNVPLTQQQLLNMNSSMGRTHPQFAIVPRPMQGGQFSMYPSANPRGGPPLHNFPMQPHFYM